MANDVSTESSERELQMVEQRGADWTGSTTWEVSIPGGWSIAGAGASGIDLIGEEGRVGYNYVNVLPGAQSPGGYIQVMLTNSPFGEITEWTPGDDIARHNDDMGRTWRTQFFEYERRQDEQTLKGSFKVAVSNFAGLGGVYSSTRAWNIESSTDDWSDVEPLLKRIGDSIEVRDQQPAIPPQPTTSPNQTQSTQASQPLQYGPPTTPPVQAPQQPVGTPSNMSQAEVNEALRRQKEMFEMVQLANRNRQAAMDRSYDQWRSGFNA